MALVDKITIIVADDDPYSLKLVGDALKDEYRIVSAHNGTGVLEQLERNKNVAALIMDFLMPDTDPIKVMETIRSNPEYEHLPIIVVTGMDTRETHLELLNAGAADFITKPVDQEILRIRVKNLIDRERSLKNLKRQKKLMFRDETDKLTGLLSRDAFVKQVTEKVETLPANSYVLECFNLDNFKMINDRYGHREGDRLLKYVGLIHDNYDDGQILNCHDTADNFLCLLPNNEGYMDSFAEDVLGALHNYDLPTNINAHIGRYIIDEPLQDVNLMIDRAMMAMRSIKAKVGETVALFDDNMREEMLIRQELTDEMHSALEEEQFVVFFQPQYNYARQEMTGAEALVRWQHPVKGMIPPDRFIPLFEENGFIYSLDRYVWERTCRYLREWIDAGLTVVPVSVNVSRVDISDPDLPDFLVELVEKYGLKPSMLNLEITESAYVENSTQLIYAVNQLKERGFTIEMDDFGAGYSSLNTLKDVPVDVLKLDMRFNMGGDTSGKSRGGNILSSIVRMAHLLKLPVIAEGVEEADQAEYLKSIGCFLMQGWLFARPMNAGMFEDLLRRVTAAENPFTLRGNDVKGAADFMDASTQATLLFNSFVGGASIMEYDGQDIEIIRTNDSFFTVLGVTRDELNPLGSINHLLYPKYMQRLITSFERAILTGHEAGTEVKGKPLREDGGDIWLNVHIRYLAQNVHRYIFYVSIENITEKKTLEKSLAFEVAKSKALIANAPGGVIIMANEKGRVYCEYASEGVGKLLGYRQEELVERFKEDPYFALTGRNRGDNAKYLRQCMTMQFPIKLVAPLLCRDSRVIWCDITGNPVSGEDGIFRVYCSLTDISEQVNSAESLKLEKQRTEAALNSVSMLLWEYDIEESSFRRLTSYGEGNLPEYMLNAPESMIERGCIDSDSAEAFRELHEKVRSGATDVTQDIHYHRTPGDEGMWFRLSYRTIYKDGRAVRAIGTAMDVSAENETKARLREFELAMNVSSLFFWSYDFGHHQFLAVSESAERLGIRDIIRPADNGLDNYGLLLPDSWKTIDEFRQNARSDNPVDGVMRLHFEKEKAGAEWVETTYTIIKDENGAADTIVALAEDITDRVANERKYLDEIENMESMGGRDLRAKVHANLTENSIENKNTDHPIDWASYDDSIEYLIRNVVYEDQKDTVRQTLTREKLLEAYAKSVKEIIVDYELQFPEEKTPHWIRTMAKLYENPTNHDIKVFIYSYQADRHVVMRRIVEAARKYVYDLMGMIFVDSGIFRGLTPFSHDNDPGAKIETDYDESLRVNCQPHFAPNQRAEAVWKLSLQNVVDELEKNDTYSVKYPVYDLEGNYITDKQWNFFWMNDERREILILRSSIKN